MAAHKTSLDRKQQIIRLPSNEKERMEILEWLNKQSNKSAAVVLAIKAMIKKYGNNDLQAVQERMFMEDWDSNGQRNDDQSDKYIERATNTSNKESNPTHKDESSDMKDENDDGMNPMGMLS